VGNRLMENHFRNGAGVGKMLTEKHFRSGDGSEKVTYEEGFVRKSFNNTKPSYGKCFS